MSNPSGFVIENGVLKKYTGPGGDVVIPEGVTYIGDSVFRDCNSLTSVTIPEGVTVIGDHTFSDCHWLTSVVIPESVTSIGDGAFHNCNHLTSVHITDVAAWCTISFGEYDSNPLSCAQMLYLNGELIEDLTIPEGVPSIGKSAFRGCGNLTSVAIPESVTSIGDFAFYGCSSLTNVAIPESVTSIGDLAFYGCSSLTSVVIPESVTSIGFRAFSDCYRLTSVAIPEGVTSIGDEAFYRCGNLTSVVIPESVTNIGDRAFKDCRKLTDSSRFTLINNIVFDYIGNAGDLSIPEGVTRISDAAFSGCRSLTRVTIPKSVTSIGGHAFSNCSSLTSITIPESVTSIGGDAFWGCESLTNVHIMDVAAWCAIKFDDKGSNPLSCAHMLYLNGALIKDLTIPEGVQSIGDYAFRDYTKLMSVTISVSVTSIGYAAFSYCSSLTSVVIPESVTSIGDGAFYSCSSLTSVEIPENVTSVGASAFEDCSKLTSVEIPEGVTVIGDRAFKGCGGLADRNGFTIVNSIVFDFTGAGGDLIIPDGVTRISRFTFCNCSNLTSVTIPEGVTGIGDGAFSGCSSLTSVTIPEGVTSIGESVFQGCSSLTSVTIPESVTCIGREAFSGCSSLTGVTIPESVTGIGWGAFSGCSSLTSVTIAEGVNGISSRAFSGCNSLTSVTIPEGVARIGDNAFFNCTSLKEVHLARSAFDIFMAMADREFKENVLVKYIWRALDPSCQAVFFLSRQGKSLIPAYLDVTDDNDAMELGEAILTYLPEKASVKECNAVAAFIRMFGVKISGDLLRRLYGTLQSQKNSKKALAGIESDEEIKALLANKDSETAGIEDPFIAMMLEYKFSAKAAEARLKDYYGLELNELPALLSMDGMAVPAPFFAWLLTAHEERRKGWHGEDLTAAAWQHPGLCPAAEEAVSMLDAKSLQSALSALGDEHLVAYQSTKRKFLTYPICRYANEETMSALTKRAPKWRTYVSGNDAPPLLQLRDAVKYSNTRAAMLFAERYLELDKYAALRGMSEEVLRDKYLSDVGLDEQGGKAYDLGNRTVTARLQKDLSFLFELPDGKTAKSLPKKGADPEKYEAAKADFDEMRKSVKKIVKSRSDKLFRDFLSGNGTKAGDWQEAYLNNPLLRSVAELVVWDQNGNSFVLRRGKPIDSAGQPYSITEVPIKTAHPMEMEPETVIAWQKYFNCYGLKQPFLQIWEPVIDPGTIREDRYEGSVQPMYRFVGKEKHGIHSGNLHVYSEDVGFSLDDCDLDYESSTWLISYDGADEETYTLGKFSFGQYTRRVNHIVSMLDGWTVEDRIKKDDPSISDRLDRFTLAQITGFINMAREAQAVNVLPLLLEYKNTHFADFDPMDEFTLE